MKLTALGGLGHIGANMMLIEDNSTSFAIDCGVKFPDEDAFNLNFLTPDFKQIKKLDKIIITHGHEDHIGALAVIMDYFPQVEVYAPPFAHELIREKLNYLKKKLRLIKINPDNEVRFGKFKIDYIHVNHSIPHTYGLGITHKDQDQYLFYVSDFKVDPTATHERPFDFKKLKEKSSSFKKRILMADSTNITSRSLKARSENELEVDLEEAITKAKGRVFITLFSSNIHRVNAIIDIAVKNKIKIASYGRSIQKYVAVAEETKVLHKDARVLEAEELSKKDRAIILITGCQGELRGALRRICSGDDKFFKPNENDTFVFSSKTIPGNEKNVHLIMNELSQYGASIINDGEIKTHATGHASKEDLSMLYREYQPTDIIPIHGEYLFLNEHLRFAQKDFPQAKSHLMNNGQSLSLDYNQFKIKTEFEAKYLYFHGRNIEIKKSQINERRRLAQNGSIFISLTSGKRKPLIKVDHYGIPENFLNLEDLKKLVSSELSHKLSNEENAEHIRVVTRRFYDGLIGYKPQTFVHVF